MQQDESGPRPNQLQSRLDIEVSNNGLCRSLTFRGRRREPQALSWPQLLKADSTRFATTFLDGATAGDVDAVCIRTLSLANLDPLGLFEFAARLLRVGGLVICAVRPRPRRWRAFSAPDPNEHLCALALRCGFRCVEHSPLTAPYGRQRGLLVFCREAQPPRWRLRVVSDADISQFLELFKKSFGTDYDPKLWDWKYTQGGGCTVGVWRDGEMIGHFGGTQRSISYRGRKLSALQICDVMVHPASRGVMVKQGALFNAAATCFELYLGIAGHHLAYGFPTQRHMVLGEKLGLYREVAKMVKVQWDVRQARHTDLRAMPLSGSRFSTCVERAWVAMRRSLRHAVCTVRDRAYVEYRYRRHPLNRYRIICVQTPLLRVVKGILVLRKENADCELVDVIGPLSNVPELVSEARYQALQWSCSSLYCWITERYSPYFIGDGGTVSDLGASVAISVWVPGSPPAPQTEHWWMMSGDTEFR